MDPWLDCRYALLMGHNMDLRAPIFLIAVPQLADNNFVRSVILLLEHQASGSMGVVINRPTALPIDEFCASQDMVFQGDVSGFVHELSLIHI